MNCMHVLCFTDKKNPKQINKKWALAKKKVHKIQEMPSGEQEVYTNILTYLKEFFNMPFSHL